MEHRIRLIVLLFIVLALEAREIDSKAIAQKIYQNECSANPKYLVHWNRGENFPSLGIGHFIWYPDGVHEKFEESFPQLISYMLYHDKEVPSWLRGAAPWQRKKEMLLDARVEQLRGFLKETMPLQATFMVKRLQEFAKKNPAIQKQFQWVENSPDGYYLLIDYLNFKGSGTNPKERYQEEGWGLFQVLSCMKGQGDAKTEFAMCAKKILQRRVENAPKKRGETRWLKGWFHRIDTYMK